uniref:hypothetical protein n=1 Tax=Xanthomonas oryzae TaxID=347 RepID=UPI003D9FDCD9
MVKWRATGPIELTRADGSKTRGVTGGDGIIQLQQGQTLENVAVRLLPRPAN